MKWISLVHMSVYLFSEWMHRISFLFLLLFHNNLSGDTKLGCTNIFLKKLVVIVEQFWGDFTVIVEDFHTTSWKIKKSKDSFQFCNRGVIQFIIDDACWWLKSYRPSSLVVSRKAQTALSLLKISSFKLWMFSWAWLLAASWSPETIKDNNKWEQKLRMCKCINRNW